MAYNKVNWNSSKPITVSNLQNMDEGIYNNSKSNIYSTEEVIIGTYNGKPLYRTILISNIGYSTEASIDVSSLNIDTLTPKTSIMNKQYYQSVQFLLVGHYESSKDYSRWYLVGTNIVLRFGSDYSYFDKTIIMNLEYTKTTD